MSKSKRRETKPARKSVPPVEGPPAAATATILTHQPPAPSRPPGQRLYDMPYSAHVPSPVRPDLGLASLVARAGHNAGYDIDLTLLDAADHRLIRTGVLLAHRVLDGRGEWYLGAPDWVPLLPKELIVPMGQAELPDALAEMVRPFRRGATFSPVAALRCERREFSLRDADARTVALLRDDKVTVRRNGLTTARYREVMLTPVGPGVDETQTAWLAQCFAAAGATEVERFPRLVRRLGAPATGPSDLPAPAPLAAGTFGQFLTQLLGAGVRDLIAADLAVTGGEVGAEERLVESAGILRDRLAGLRDVLDPDWVDDAIDDLSWLVAPSAADDLPSSSTWPRRPERSDDLAALGGPSTVAETAADSAATVSGNADGSADRLGCRRRLHSQRYLALLDRLVAAARAPKTGDDVGEPAAERVEAVYRLALTRFARAADRLAVDGTAQTWDAAWAAARDLSRTLVIRALVAHDRTRSDRERLAGCFALLEQASAANRTAEKVLAGVDDLTPAEAFDAGRRFERDRDTARTARSELVGRWPKTRRKLL